LHGTILAARSRKKSFIAADLAGEAPPAPAKSWSFIMGKQATDDQQMAIWVTNQACQNHARPTYSKCNLTK
jgi:phage terminase large subunit-like protein